MRWWQKLIQFIFVIVHIVINIHEMSIISLCLILFYNSTLINHVDLNVLYSCTQIPERSGGGEENQEDGESLDDLMAKMKSL